MTEQGMMTSAEKAAKMMEVHSIMATLKSQEGGSNNIFAIVPKDTWAITKLAAENVKTAMGLAGAAGSIGTIVTVRLSDWAAEMAVGRDRIMSLAAGFKGR